MTWFAVGGLGPELAGPAERLLMDYERHGDEWWHGYPAGTPQLERCWENFSEWAPAMLRQAARLDPVPWREALRELCDRTGGGVGWWLTGSAALAVRGAPIEPGDLDLVCTAEEAVRLGEVFADAVVEPVAKPAAGPEPEPSPDQQAEPCRRLGPGRARVPRCRTGASHEHTPGTEHRRRSVISACRRHRSQQTTTAAQIEGSARTADHAS